MEEKLTTPIQETTDSNINKNRKKIFIKIILPIVTGVLLLFCCIFLGLKIYSNDIKVGSITINNPLGITDEYLTNHFTQNGFDQFDSYKVHKIVDTDIAYQGYNKLVLTTVEIKNNGVTYQRAGLLLVNRQKDIVNGFTINNNIAYILYGICKEPCDHEKAVKICAKYISENGIEIFANNSEVAMINELTDIISIRTARKYVEEYFKKEVTNKIEITTEYTLLYTKGTAVVSYIAFKETGLKFNSAYPIDERMYNYFKNSYSHRDTLNSLQYVYGNPYILKTEYSYMKVGDSSVQGTRDSLNEIKKLLNVEELNEISDYVESSAKSEDVKNNISTEVSKTESTDAQESEKTNNTTEENDDVNSLNEESNNTNTETSSESEKIQNKNYSENSSISSNNYESSSIFSNNYENSYTDSYSDHKPATETTPIKQSKPEQVNVYNIKCLYPKFDDGKSELEKAGLIVNEILDEQEVEYLYYSEDSDNIWNYEGNKTQYDVGETINIIHKKYKKVATKIRTRIDFRAIFDDFDKIPLLEKNTSQNNIGLKVYIDDKMAFTYNFSKYYSTSQAYEYPFEPNKTVHIKLVAPSSCPYRYLVYYGHVEEPDEYGEEWIVKEYDIDTNDLPQYFDLYTFEKWY